MGFFDKIKELNKKQQEHMKKAQSKKNKVHAQLFHLEGLPNVKEGEKISLELNPKDNKLYMGKVLILNKKEDATVLDMDKVEYVESTTVAEIKEKNKSVIGRAVVGSLLGPVGAVIGGISGVGSKKKENNRNILIIGYKSNGKERQISFIDDKGGLIYNLLYKELKKYVVEEIQGTGQTEL